ncbi:ATP-grasp fold amidoligase family protein [Lachnoanaerobaculum gingivalis]|uniref:ATP-grasp fold amidoligase family protein n=1 Tax=Lachnoanaerobaculum gingivalis TaxID=2490855 RepID=UPI0024A6F4D0|nr:ATP-grasp fold amidoligase family protein [Lachnoanaerobaculum gingivalis]WHE86209.1 ATP-grasp fold amidoligase family protein [Lachnoanaerobaculum gingivalis]
MLDVLKKRFPGIYDYYQHMKRMKVLANAKRLESLPEEKYNDLIEKEYLKVFGNILDWNNLRTYTEKMQWEKIYNKNPIKTTLTDKYAVREWVEGKIGKDYLIPLIGVWDSFDNIDFDLMPKQFVLKTNHGTGTNLIVKDKNKINMRRAKRMFDDWMKTDYAFTNSLQLHYRDIKRKIIAEKYLETNLGELQDYKFLCFDGKPCFCWVDLGRYSKHTRTVFDMNWKLQPWTQASYGIANYDIPKPKNFDMMIDIANILSKGFSHVRVDLYNVDGKIYFGEMTFTNGSGLDPIIPKEYDKVLGDYWKLSKNKDGKTKND